MAHRSIARGVAHRQSGQVVEATLQAQVWSRRLSHLGLSTDVEVKKDEQKGPVNCMSLDAVEDRYLLVGAGDSSIGVYDLEDGKKDAYDPVSTCLSHFQHYMVIYGSLLTASMTGLRCRTRQPKSLHLRWRQSRRIFAAGASSKAMISP